MVLISTLVITIALIFIDVIPIYRQQAWKAFFVYCFFLGILLIFAILMELNIDIPSPSEPTRNIVSFIFGLGQTK
ncbi:MAG: hypothetical protein GX957_08010 [Clostridiaceae bacterium]|nr:hypothetical protein [Clostridiaceae bacterium]